MALIDDDAEVIRIRRPWGFIELTNNEVTVASTVDDPPALRLHALGHALGKVSFGRIRSDGSVDEYALVQGKKDERTREREDIHYGELTVHLKGPLRSPTDDGMQPSILALHDYVWMKNLDGGPSPQPPVLTLPPVVVPEEPADPWLSPESQVKRRAELTRIAEEVAPMPLDEDRVKSYLMGRNRNLAEVHDDELTRSGLDHDPCEGKNRIPIP